MLARREGLAMMAAMGVPIEGEEYTLYVDGMRTPSNLDKLAVWRNEPPTFGTPSSEHGRFRRASRAAQ
jgi:hypothetical protein